MNDNHDIAITSIHGLLIVMLGHLCYHGLYTFLLALAMYGTYEQQVKYAWYHEEFSRSYNMTLMHIKSNSYLFLYPHTANIKDFVTKLVEHTQFSNFF